MKANKMKKTLFSLIVTGGVTGGAIGALGVSTVAADAPRGSSYAKSPDEEAPPPVQTLIEGDATADLQIKNAPAKPKNLAMRGAKQKQVAKADGDAGAADDGAASVSYKMFPTTARDFRERVTFRIRAGVAVETAPASGDTLRGGFPLADGFTDTRPWIGGDVVVGARGIILPTLNGYFMSSFMFDASDSLVDRVGTIHPSDSGDQIAIKAGYAEYGREDRKPDDQQPPFWLRAGRQFRLDGGALFAYFDGLTVGYRQKAWNASVFFGQRATLYVDTEKGLLFGGTFSLDLKRAVNIPGRVYANYTGLNIKSTDFDGIPDADGNFEKDAETRHLINLGATLKPNKKLKLDVRTRLTGLADVEGTDAGEIPATKFGLGRVGARGEYEAGSLIVIGDVEQRFKDDVAYDLAAASSVDIVNVADKLGVGMNTPINATTLGVRVDWQNKKRSVELVGFGRTEIPNETPEDVDHKAWLEAGLAIAGSPIGVRGSGVYTTLQYRYRQYTDEGEGDGDMRIDGVCNDFTDADMDGFPDNCQDFGNSASSGVDRMQEVAGEASLATRGGGGQRWRFSAGAFFRVYDIQTPYREVTNDARGGGRLQLQWWFSRDFHLDVAGEAAQSSPTLARDLGVITSLRAAVEARW